MLLLSIPILDHPFKPKPVRRRYAEFDPGAHNPESDGPEAMGILKQTRSSGGVH
jgi:hypothetical protein